MRCRRSETSATAGQCDVLTATDDRGRSRFDCAPAVVGVVDGLDHPAGSLRQCPAPRHPGRGTVCCVPETPIGRLHVLVTTPPVDDPPVSIEPVTRSLLERVRRIVRHELAGAERGSLSLGPERLGHVQRGEWGRSPPRHDVSLAPGERGRHLCVQLLEQLLRVSHSRGEPTRVERLCAAPR